MGLSLGASCSRSWRRLRDAPGLGFREALTGESSGITDAVGPVAAPRHPANRKIGTDIPKICTDMPEALCCLLSVKKYDQSFTSGFLRKFLLWAMVRILKESNSGKCSSV